MKVELTSEQAKKIVPALLKGLGGLASMGASQAPAIVDDWASKGLTLQIDTDARLYSLCVEKGIINAG